MRKFNTEGPVVARDHYCIPPLERLNLPSILELIGDKRYFVLHAPRQTGKTSALLALRDLLNSGGVGEFRCVYVNVEAAQAVREDVRRAMQVILGELASRARSAGDEFLYDAWPDILATFGDGALAEALTRWCENTAAPVVLLIDEIDTLIGDTLIAVLRQLRARYDRRPESFPQSVVLCGVRDVRDYRIQSSAENAAVAGGSAFNVRAESLRLGDFTEAEVRVLLDQHTRETGQPFTPEALETVWRQTRGQPWLVNALCRRVCFDAAAGRDVNDDGGLDVDRLLGAFQAFFREHSEHWLGRFDYAEAGPQLILQAFLQRVVNGGGRIEREYGLGRGRTDLLIVWPRGGATVPDAATDRFVIECKVAHKGLERTIAEGTEQTSAYMDRCAARTGHLVVFDRRADRSWDEKIFRRDVRRDGRAITVWGT